jgi:uncharacterized protein YggT (Ycf19 family)
MLMGLIDDILNLAGLLLWLSWRSVQYDPLARRTPATLVGTLRPAQPSRWQRWHLLAVIAALLLVRAFLYWLIGSANNWVGRLDFGVISIPIPFHGRLSDLVLRISLYSVLSFGLALGVVYLWLLLLSILAGPDPIHRLVRVQLGAVDRWPRWVKGLLPLLLTAAFWWLATWLFASLDVSTYSRTHFIPRPNSAAQRLESALIVGVGSYLVWKFVIGLLLILYLLNTYLYFGDHPFWDYVNATARTLLHPLRRIPLRVFKVDFTPVVGLAITFFAAEQMQKWLGWLYGKLPY